MAFGKRTLKKSTQCPDHCVIECPTQFAVVCESMQNKDVISHINVLTFPPHALNILLLHITCDWLSLRISIMNCVGGAFACQTCEWIIQYYSLLNLKHEWWLPHTHTHTVTTNAASPIDIHIFYSNPPFECIYGMIKITDNWDCRKFICTKIFLSIFKNLTRINFSIILTKTCWCPEK